MKWPTRPLYALGDARLSGSRLTPLREVMEKARMKQEGTSAPGNRSRRDPRLRE